jgi:hypothetical protein
MWTPLRPIILQAPLRRGFFLLRPPRRDVVRPDGDFSVEPLRARRRPTGTGGLTLAQEECLARRRNSPGIKQFTPLRGRNEGFPGDRTMPAAAGFRYEAEPWNRKPTSINGMRTSAGRRPRVPPAGAIETAGSRLPNIGPRWQGKRPESRRWPIGHEYLALSDDRRTPYGSFFAVVGDRTTLQLDSAMIGARNQTIFLNRRGRDLRS